MRGLQAEELLRLPVRLRGIRLGTIADVLFAPEGDRVVGFDVLCGDSEHRFLPFSAMTLVPGGVEITTTLTLLDEQQLDFYRDHSRSLARGD